jgi:hypothetical protein
MSIATKLLIRPGNHVRLVGAPPEYAQLLRELRPDVVFDDTAHGADIVQTFVNSCAELKSRGEEFTALPKPSGILWITYPKKSSGVESDLSRDRVREAMQPTGWRPVTQIAIDDTWSALRFRPEAEVGSSR